MLKIVIFDISCACCVPLCAYNVPDVCTYLMVAQSQKAMSQLSNAVSWLFLRQKLVSVTAFQFFAKIRKSSKNVDSRQKNTPLLNAFDWNHILRQQKKLRYKIFRTFAIWTKPFFAIITLKIHFLSVIYSNSAVSEHPKPVSNISTRITATSTTIRAF